MEIFGTRNRGQMYPPLQVTPSPGQAFKEGQVLQGKIFARQGDNITLKLGGQTLTATTALPLSVGETVDLRVLGQVDGKLNLQLMRSLMFTPITEGDVANLLHEMQLPATEHDMAVAKGMVEHGVPLNQTAFTDVSKALAQLPGGTFASSDVSAACFLKLANLPMTGQNMAALSTFIASHPMLGAQLFDVQKSFRLLAQRSDIRSNGQLMEALGRVPGFLASLATEPRGKAGGARTGKNLYRMAKEAGIERLEGFAGNEEDMEAYLDHLRALLQRGPDDEETAQALALLFGLKENVNAQRLINRGILDRDGAFFLFQVPVKADGDLYTAEVRIGCRRDDEEKWVDPENTHIEFSVNGGDMGEVRFTLDIVEGTAHLDVGAADDRARRLIERLLPILKRKLELMGYGAGRAHVHRLKEECSPIIEKEEFETIERLNLKM